MKKLSLSKLENYYYYAINRYFWHIIIALSLLIIISGIAVYGWSYVPPKKKEVVKPPQPEKAPYPELQQVDANDILKALSTRQKLPVQQEEEEDDEFLMAAEPVYTQREKSEEQTVDSVGLKMFYDELAVTKQIIPYQTNRKFWTNKYEFYFELERDKKLYRKTKNPKFRKKRLVRQAFDKNFIEFTDLYGYASYRDKAQFLRALNTMLMSLDSTQYQEFIHQYFFRIPLKKYSPEIIENRYNVISKAVKAIPEKEKKFYAYNILWNFIEKNPQDGYRMVQYQADNINRFVPEIRLAALQTMHDEYYRHYDYNLAGFKESTDNFFKIINSLPQDKRQADALKIYYDKYWNNNLERSKQIKQIDREYAQAVRQWEENYQLELMQAENEFKNKLNTRKKFRNLSIKSIGLAFVTVLLLSIILLIISMIRNVNRLTEAVYENNRLFIENMKNPQKEKS